MRCNYVQENRQHCVYGGQWQEQPGPRKQRVASLQGKLDDEPESNEKPVSYTHLTLPTNREV